MGVLVVALTRWLGGRSSCKYLLIIGIAEVIAGIVLPHINPQLKGAGYFLSGIGGVVLLAGMVWVNNRPAGEWPRRLGWLAFAAVQLQGLLGGLRVVLYYDSIGILHAALAQIFLTLLAAVALLTSGWWNRLSEMWPAMVDRSRLRPLLGATTVLIFAQLLLGATMRHQHAGLAIPDFPLAYHKLWPPMDAQSVAYYNQNREELTGVNPITAFQIGLQMAHRIMALAIGLAVAFCAWKTRSRLGGRHPLARISLGWLGLIIVQIFLGAFTIWSNKAADVATAHMVTGALTLVTGAILTIIAFRVLIPAHVPVRESVEPAAAGSQLAPGVK